MKKYEEPLTQDAVLLNRYLTQYRVCVARMRNLKNRRDEIISEFDNPLKGINYGEMSHGGSSGSGCAALSYRLDEINRRVKEQMEKSVKVLDDIMNIIDFLPENSIERYIIEHRYIDRYNWEQVCRSANISRTPATKYWRKGLYMLLEFKKVQKIIEEYKRQQDENFLV